MKKIKIKIDKIGTIYAFLTEVGIFTKGKVKIVLTYSDFEETDEGLKPITRNLTFHRKVNLNKLKIYYFPKKKK